MSTTLEPSAPVSSHASETFDSLDPATGDLVGTHPVMGRDEVDAAVARAQHHHRVGTPLEHERLHDLTHRHVQGGCRERSGAGGLAERGDLDVQPPVAQALRQAGRGRVHPCPSASRR